MLLVRYMQFLTVSKESNLGDNIGQYVIFETIVSIFNQCLFKIDLLLELMTGLCSIERVKHKLKLTQIYGQEITTVVDAC